MTRGKFAARAEGVREQRAVNTTIADYQKKVRDLTAELKAEKEGRRADKARLESRIQKLLAQNREGTNDALEARDRLIAELRESHGNLKAAADWYKKSATRTQRHLLDVLQEMGLSYTESWEASLNAIKRGAAEDGVDGWADTRHTTVTSAKNPGQRHLSADQQMQIERARGKRH